MFEDRSLTQLFPTAADVPEAARVRPSDSPPVMLIDGKVTTSGGSYTYVNKSLDLTAGVLPPGA